MSAKAPAVLVVDDNAEFADLLGTLLAEQGLVPVLAHTGANALILAKLYNPAALVIDLLLPDMTGHKLLQALARPGGPPVCVMTGVFKGHTQLERVRSIAPIAGWFEKPFDTRVLVEQLVRLTGLSVVGRVEHQKVGRVTETFDIRILDPIEAEGISDDGPAAPVFGLTPTPEVEIEIEVGGEAQDADALALWDVVEAATPSRPTVRGPPPPEAARPAPPASTLPPPRPDSAPRPDWLGGSTNPFQEALKAGFGAERSASALAASAGLRAKMRSGPLRPATVARLLTAFHVSRETGEIAFERGSERKVVYVSGGRPVYARSNQDSERFGAIARRVFGLTEEHIELALKIARAQDRMIGEVLIELGMIDERHRLGVVREQTRSIIRSLLTWTDGRYVIGFNVLDQIERAELEEHPASIVISGIRDLLDTEHLRTLVPDRMRPMPSSNPPYELFELPVGDEEALLLLRSTGARPVSLLVAELGPRLGEHGVRALIYAFLLLGILVAGRRPAGPPAPPP